MIFTQPDFQNLSLLKFSFWRIIFVIQVFLNSWHFLYAHCCLSHFLKILRLLPISICLHFFSTWFLPNVFVPWTALLIFSCISSLPFPLFQNKFKAFTFSPLYFSFPLKNWNITLPTETLMWLSSSLILKQ